MANFFHTPKPKTFKMQPRFWDPEKEEREARHRRSAAEVGGDKDKDYKPYIGKGEFKKGLSNSKWTPQVQRRKTNTRLLIMIGLAAALVWYMLR